MFHSIILTVHNKDYLIADVLNSIYRNTVGDYEVIVVIDGCTDETEDIVNVVSNSVTKVIHTPDVFETKANNAGLRKAKGDYAIIVQDDMVIHEKGWNKRMQEPFDAFDDVFAVTANTAHNWVINPRSLHLGMKEDLDSCWCDILHHTDHAQRNNTPRNVFAVRATANRGPLMIDMKDLKTMGYFDEEFAPQDMDDHDLMFRMHKELNKVCGCYWIDYESRDEWGGTRVDGYVAPWLLKANQKNMKIFHQRHKDLLGMDYENENRVI